jgi:nicotinate-nucleotide adenylyltransferase
MPQATREGRRVAFFGGSFDPPHRGHLAVARAAQVALDLDTVLFAPVGSQPLKPQGSTASFDDRLAMTRLAIAGEPAFCLSLADAPIQGSSAGETPNYSFDTLVALKKELPASGALFCLIGADSFLGLRRWHRGAEIPFIAPLIVASRPGQSLADLAKVLPAGLSINPDPTTPSMPLRTELRAFTLCDRFGATAPFYLLPGLHIEISASEIRRQVRAADRTPAGHALPADLPESVFAYIAAHNLYR